MANFYHHFSRFNFHSFFLRFFFLCAVHCMQSKPQRQKRPFQHPQVSAMKPSHLWQREYSQSTLKDNPVHPSNRLLPWKIRSSLFCSVLHLVACIFFFFFDVSLFQTAELLKNFEERIQAHNASMTRRTEGNYSMAHSGPISQGKPMFGGTKARRDSLPGFVSKPKDDFDVGVKSGGKNWSRGANSAFNRGKSKD